MLWLLSKVAVSASKFITKEPLAMNVADRILKSALIASNYKI